MKRLIALAAAIALAASMATAAPTIWGSSGLFRTINAQNAGPMNFGIGAYVYGWTWYGDSSATVPKQGATDLGIVPSGYFSITDMIELSAGTNYLMPSRYVEYGGTKYTYNPSGLGDTRFGLKVSIPARENVWLAVYGGYDMATRADTFLPGNGYEHKGGIDVRLLGDWMFGSGGCLTLNAGMYYRMDKYYKHTGLDSSLVNIYPNMSIPFGVGFSYDLGMLTPYAEVSARFMNDTTKYPKPGSTTGELVSYDKLNNPAWAGAGVRFYVSGLNVTVGGEYNLMTDNRPDPMTYGDDAHWHAIFGLAYAPKRDKGAKVPSTGIIAGTVTDKATGRGLLATVSAGGITANTTPAGAYRLEGIAIGQAPVEVRAEAKEYLSGSAAVPLTRKNRTVPAIQDFALTLKPIPQSEVTGNVMDYKSGSPVVAVIAFKDTMGNVRTIKTDFKGAFKIMVDQGKYGVQFGADGYYPKSLIMHPVGGAPLAKQTVYLVKIGDKFVFTDVNFTIGKAQLGPNAAQLLESIAKILRENPELRIEIGGHTSSPGSAAYNQQLSEARANVVRNALIADYGIKPDRMTHKGYGEESPVATNNTKAGRALNRRMEVTVIQ